MQKYSILLTLFLLVYIALPSSAQRDDRKKSSDQENEIGRAHV